MDGRGRWVAVIVAALVAVGAMGLVATQLQLSRAKEHPCGTALRIDLREPTRYRDRAMDLEGAGDGDPVYPSSRTPAELYAMASRAEDRCKDRQRLALLGLGAGGLAVVCAVGFSTYRLGRRAGRLEAGRPSEE